MVAKRHEENWEFYINYSREHYPKEYNDMDFDIEKKEWVKKVTEVNIKEIEIVKEIKEVKTKKKKKHKVTPRTLKQREFHKVRDTILERDNFKCVECGSKYEIHVHHIIASSKGGSNNPNNLVTLCYHCHMKKHEGEPVYKLMKHRLRIKTQSYIISL